MIAEDVCNQLEQVCKNAHTASVEIGFLTAFPPGRLPWICNIHADKQFGCGTGESLLGAIEDMLEDFAREKPE